MKSVFIFLFRGAESDKEGEKREKYLIFERILRITVQVSTAWAHYGEQSDKDTSRSVQQVQIFKELQVFFSSIVISLFKLFSLDGGQKFSVSG